MAPSKESRSHSSRKCEESFLDELNHHPNLDIASDCPDTLRIVFELINQTRLGFDDLQQSNEGNNSKASQIYDKQLMWRAQEMSQACSIRGLNDVSESQWQEIMSRHAFLSLNSSEEEKTNNDRQYHDCLACRRVFPSGSRPLLYSPYNPKARVKAKVTLEPVGKSQTCYSHLNLPHFVLRSKLKFDYPGEKNGSYGFPDATIGLCTYNLKNEPWQEQWPDLRSDPWIQPFSTSFLKTIFRYHQNLKGPYHSQVLKDSTPLFAFALWEAKKSDGDSSWSAFQQLGKKVRCWLKWQHDISITADNDIGVFYPTVWAFTSVGPLWTIYGCYQSVYHEDKVAFRSSVELWSGNVSDKNKALQFLWIVDIIKFWAQYTFKPFLGACLDRLKAESEKRVKVALDETLWKSRITLEKKTTPWFFFETSLCRSNIDQTDSFSKMTLCRRPTLNLKLIEKYTWIQDRDPGKGHLLVIRVERKGKVAARPLVLLNSDVIKCKNKRQPFHAGVDVGHLKINKGGINVLQSNQHHFSSKTHQFCAILPIKYKVYQPQRQKPKRKSFFEAIEKELDLDGFYRTLDRELKSSADHRESDQDNSSSETSHEEDSAKSKKKKEKRTLIKLNSLLECVDSAWQVHSWPDRKTLFFAFARVGFALGVAKRNAFNELEDYPVVYTDSGEDGEGCPEDWMIPQKSFGRSAILLTRQKESSSSDNDSAGDA